MILPENELGHVGKAPSTELLPEGEIGQTVVEENQLPDTPEENKTVEPVEETASTVESETAPESSETEQPFWSQYGSQEEVQERLKKYNELVSNSETLQSKLSELESKKLPENVQHLLDYILQHDLNQEDSFAQAIDTYRSLQLADFNTMDPRQLMYQKYRHQGFDHDATERLINRMYDQVEITDEMSEVEQIFAKQRNEDNSLKLQVDSMEARKFMNQLKQKASVPEFKQRQTEQQQQQMQLMESLKAEVPKVISDMKLKVGDTEASFNITDAMRADIVNGVNEILPSTGIQSAEQLQGIVNSYIKINYFDQIISSVAKQVETKKIEKDHEELRGVPSQNGAVVTGDRPDAGDFSSLDFL